MKSTNALNTQKGKSPTSRFRRLLKEQFGGSDMEMIAFVAVLVTVATVIYLLLGWVKSVKDERVETNKKTYQEYMKRKNQKPEDRGPAAEQMVF